MKYIKRAINRFRKDVSIKVHKVQKSCTWQSFTAFYSLIADCSIY